VDELTVEQAAEVIGVSGSRVRQLIRATELTPSRRVGGAYLIRRHEVERFAALPPSDPRGRPRKQQSAARASSE